MMFWSISTKPMRLTRSGLATLPISGRIVGYAEEEQLAGGWSD